MRHLVLAACLCAVIGWVTPVQSQVVDFGQIKISESLVQGVRLTADPRLQRHRVTQRTHVTGKGWMARNWKWFVPVLVGGGVLAVVVGSGGDRLVLSGGASKFPCVPFPVCSLPAGQ